MPYRLSPPVPRPSRLSFRPIRALESKPNPPRPIATTSPLLAYIWSSHQHFRKHNDRRVEIHRPKFASALDVPRHERRPQPGEFKYSIYGPFGKHYGQIVKLHAWKAAEEYWGKSMLRVWSMVKSQAWVAQREEERLRRDRKRRLKEEEERAWEAVDMLGEMRRNLNKDVEAGVKPDNVRIGTEEGLKGKRESSESSTPIPEVGSSPKGASAHTDKSAAGPSGSESVTVEENVHSSDSKISPEQSPEVLPSWAQPFVDPSPTYDQNLNYNDIPSWAIPIINSLPKEPFPSKFPSNTPLSLYSPFRQHHTSLVLDPTPVESAYLGSHTLNIYHQALTNHPTLSQEAHDTRTLPFLRGVDMELREFRFNSFDYLFRAVLRRHIGKATLGLGVMKEQEEQGKARRGRKNTEEQEKVGRWNQWEEMIADEEISPPGLGRFNGLMGQKLRHLKSPEQKDYYPAQTQQRWSREKNNENEAGKQNRKRDRAGVSNQERENWVKEVLMGKAEPAPKVEEDEVIDLAPELEKALDVLFEKPQGKTQDATPVVTVVENRKGPPELPEVTEIVEETKRPIHEEFNEVARAGRGHLSLKRASEVTNVASHVENSNINTVEETSNTTTTEGVENGMSTTGYKQEENEVTIESTIRESETKHKYKPINANPPQARGSTDLRAAWFSNVFQDIPTTSPNTYTSQRRTTGRGTLTSSPPPFLATDFPQFSNISSSSSSSPSSSTPQSDFVSSKTHAFSSAQPHNPSTSQPPSDSLQDWAIKTGIFHSPKDRLWGDVDPLTQPLAPRSDRETKWTVHLAGELEKIDSNATSISGGQDGNEDLTDLQWELSDVRRSISRIKTNEWWKRNEGPLLGSVDLEEGVSAAPDGLWAQGKEDWRRSGRRKKKPGARSK